VSSIADQGHCFDAEIARAKRVSSRSRKFILATKQKLVAHEEWLHRHNRLWQEDLKQSQRRTQLLHAIRVCKRLACSPIVLVRLTCRALFHGTVGALKCCGRPSVGQYSFVGLTGQAGLHAIIGIAVVTLLTVGVVRAAKPVAPSEVILAILPETQNSVRLAAVASGEALGRVGRRDASARAHPGFALIPSVSIPESLPLSGEDTVAMVLMTPFPSPKSAPDSAVPRSAEILEDSVVQHEVIGTTPQTAPLATTPDVEAMKTAAVSPRPRSGEAEAGPKLKLTAERQVAEVPLSQKPKPRLAIQKSKSSGFVPYSNW
jgi:hypothetical protein